VALSQGPASFSSVDAKIHSPLGGYLCPRHSMLIKRPLESFGALENF
jgi:hypothetical protein